MSENIYPSQTNCHPTSEASLTSLIHRIAIENHNYLNSTLDLYAYIRPRLKAEVQTLKLDGT